MDKDSALRIRVQRNLRTRFLEVCHAQDRPAAQVIREFMRDYVAEHGEPTDDGYSPTANPDEKVTGKRGSNDNR